jgi:hypothetical protein
MISQAAATTGQAAATQPGLHALTQRSVNPTAVYTPRTGRRSFSVPENAVIQIAGAGRSPFSPRRDGRRAAAISAFNH